jgi:hypothetical protein
MALIFSHTRVAFSDRVITRSVDGMTVLLDARTGRTFTLDEVGSRAVAVLATSPSMEEAYERLLGEYEAEPGQLRADLEALVMELDSRHLLEVSRVP